MKAKKYFKDVLGELKDDKSVKNIDSEYELLKLVKYYYEVRFNKEERLVKKAEIESKIKAINYKQDIALKVSMISIIITLVLTIVTFYRTTENQIESSYENQKARIEDVKDSYYMKVLEVENEIKFSGDEDKKNQLISYKESVLDEMSNLDNKLTILEENRYDKKIKTSNQSNFIVFIMIGYLLLVSIMGTVEAIVTNRNKNKKHYLEMRLEIIKQI